MKIIWFAIIPLIVIGLFSVFLGDDLVSVTIRYYKWDDVDKDLDSKTINLDLGDTKNALMDIIISIIVIVAIMGINVLGSGLTGSATRIITIIVIYVVIWTTLSVLAWDLLMANAQIGMIIYVFLSLFMVIGVGNQLASGG